MMGDYNINIAPLKPGQKAHPDLHLLKNMIGHLGCKQLISNYTRLNPITGNHSTLDLIITNSYNITASGTKVISLSDHELVYVTRQHVAVPKERLAFTGRSYRFYNPISFKNEMLRLDWNNFFACDSPHDTWEMFIAAIYLILVVP